MQIYSAYPRARARQVAADVTAAASILGFALLGAAVGALVGSTAALGRGLESAGTDFEGTMSDASRTVGGIPLLGQTVASPFAQASGAGASLAQAGRDQQALIETVSVALGLLVALAPIALVLLIWLRRRIAFARRAAEVSRLANTEDGIELLALRALLTADRVRLAGLGADGSPQRGVVARWRAGDRATVRALAASALQDAGVAPGELTSARF